MYRAFSLRMNRASISESLWDGQGPEKMARQVAQMFAKALLTDGLQSGRGKQNGPLPASELTLRRS